MTKRSYASVKNPIPEITTARRWNPLLGASFSMSLTVAAATRPLGGRAAPEPLAACTGELSTRPPGLEPVTGTFAPAGDPETFFG
jgi:hypothetical protein